ncbi:MAG TPA: glutamate 5-kinase [Myxococcota bacterium]|jgi:glutamate 5-kinase|nr:glutamate 5-kinase [Myxococcota bacterium]
MGSEAGAGVGATAPPRALLRAARLAVVKVGSNVLAREGGEAFARLGSDVAAARRGGRAAGGVDVVLVSSGAIALGWPGLGLAARPRDMALLQAAAALGQPELMRRWEAAFAPHGLRVAQVLLTADGVAARDRFLNARHTMQALLRCGAVPVVNENDTVAVDEIRFGDNDHLSVVCASVVGADAVLLLTNQPGLLDRDPRTLAPGDAPPRLVPEVAVGSDCDVGSDGDVGGRDAGAPLLASGGGSGEPGAAEMGTGGMRSKVRAARTAARLGVPAVIADGRTAGVVVAALRGEAVGTLFVPSDERLASRKAWLAAATAPQGRLHVDAGAREAIVARGKSLLPRGIVRVEGEFALGDVVEVVGPDGRAFARGLASYRGAEVAAIRGRRSDEIEAALGYRTADEVVHRDDLVLLDP